MMAKGPVSGPPPASHLWGPWWSRVYLSQALWLLTHQNTVLGSTVSILREPVVPWFRCKFRVCLSTTEQRLSCPWDTVSGREGLGAAATSPSGSGTDTCCVAASTRLPLLPGWLDPEGELVLSLCAGPASFSPGLALRAGSGPTAARLGALKWGCDCCALPTLASPELPPAAMPPPNPLHLGSEPLAGPTAGRNLEILLPQFPCNIAPWFKTLIKNINQFGCLRRRFFFGNS